MVVTRGDGHVRGRSSPPGRDRATLWERVDVVLVGATLALMAFGAVMVAVTSGLTRPGLSPVLVHQLLFDGLGLLIGTGAAIVDYRRIEHLGPLAYAATLGLLLLVLSPLGTSVNGAQSWFSVGSFQFQPAEFMKLCVIVLLAAVTARGGGRLDVRRLLRSLALVGLPAALILLQPDLGSVMVLTAMTAAILVVAGTTPRHLAVLALGGVVVVVMVFQLGLLKSYQQDRLTYFLNPATKTSAGYNAQQSEIAIGSGGILGRGLFHGTQTQLKFVPEQQTDFIFSALGEDLGFLGTAAVLLLDAIIAWRIWRAAILARDLFGTLICAGVGGMFLFHVFENVGMNMGIMPITGIPLPLVSYGGSATIVTLAAIGTVVSVHSHRFS